MARMHTGAALLLAATALSGCGGGGVASTPAPTTTSTTTTTVVAPTTTTTTTTTIPAATFQTEEYYRSSGASFHNAIAAWQTGADGTGVTIGIVDSGIDATSPEFTGRIAAGSVDVAGSRTIANADSDHGTDVALVAAAARNNTGVVGIAYNATLFVARADTPGSCATTAGCSFDDTAIASGITRAVAGGAKVINMSLGGSAPGAALIAAVSAATAAGTVVIISAGNDGAANPDAFAQGLLAAGNGNVIVAGSVNSSGVISSFSNRAGTSAAAFLAALGEGVCCSYTNGTLQVTTGANGQQYVTLFSGTSFSAPQIAGAAALLMQAFPRLTGAQVVQLLLTTARTGGTAQGTTMTGTDATYGHGILDIAAAFAPQGQTTLAGTSTLAVAVGATTGVTSAAMGDAARGASLGTVLVDAYGRAYHVNLASNLHPAAFVPRLTQALDLHARDEVVDRGPVSLAFSVAAPGTVSASSGALRLTRGDAEVSRVLAARIVAQLSGRTSMGLAFAAGADGIAASLQGHEQPAFLVAGDALGDVGFLRARQNGVAVRRQLGRWGLTLSGEAAGAETAAPWNALGMSPIRRDPVWRSGLALDRRLGGVDAMVGASWLAESRTVLGARFADPLGISGADSVFLDARLGWGGGGWRLAGAWRSGMTRLRAGGLTTGDATLASNAWSLDATRAFRSGDSLQFRVSQPLRVASGGIGFDLPVDYSYATLTPTWGVRTLSLAPTGREITAEAGWHAPLWGGAGAASLFYRRNPGNDAALPDDHGVAVSWKGKF